MTVKKLFTCFIAVCFASVASADIPDMSCVGTETVFVHPESFAVEKYRSNQKYRFSSGKLFLKAENQLEYLYGEVRKSEEGRYISGHKTFLLMKNGFQTMTSVHAYNDEIRMTRLLCNAQLYSDRNPLTPAPGGCFHSSSFWRIVHLRGLW